MNPDWWLKTGVLEYSVFPQLPSFCGVAACCGAIGSILNRRITEQMLHAQYQIGLYTKLHAPASCPPDKFAGLRRSGPGFSNWDVIRLFNAVLLDEGRQPSAVVLCGKDLVRETGELSERAQLFDWLRNDSCQAIVHTVNHYTIVAGVFQSSATRDHYLVLADSAIRSGPLRSLGLAELITMAERDERYGFVLLSDKPVPRALFRIWTSAMVPSEVTEQQRFARISTS